MMALKRGIAPGQFDDVDAESSSAEEVPDVSNKVEKVASDDSDEYSDEEDDIYLFYDDEPKRGYNAQRPSTKTSSFQPREKILTGNNKLDFDTACPRSGDGNEARRKDKASRATTSQVLDQRTRLVISKMISQGRFDEITGSISVGKEANVFRAEKHTETGTEYYALKVYKTSILTFKNRSKYVEGDFRLRRAYHGSNPRKMVKTWAEKEIRNLTRIYQAGIPCPQPMLLKGHLFLMSFIGSEDGAAAPLLKNAVVSESKWRELYLDMVQDMRKLYNTCKLVHADLSEYNVLYHAGKAFIIDVSQSVEHDHPNALTFLRKDCSNITDFFRGRGVATMMVKELFDFITDLTITDGNMDAVLQAAMDTSSTRSYTGLTEQDKVDEEVFKHSFIPRNLDQVTDHEQELEKRLRGEAAEGLYHTVTGMKEDMTGAQEIPKLLEDRLQIDGSLLTQGEEGNENEDDDDEDDDSESQDRLSSKEGDQDDDDETKGTIKRPKNETAEERKERKKAVKEARREKVKTKVKKHVKKRAEKLHLSKK
ncbi:serine/threonine-protein kinase RIO1-like [Littorina saxatilis]|uniref:Serine/threonine-protein kinase RIO1 n=1 Tax=Littorina saxatilis TaxID=31220 RepID=A0AAN9GAN3_9CAEN